MNKEKIIDLLNDIKTRATIHPAFYFDVYEQGKSKETIGMCCDTEICDDSFGVDCVYNAWDVDDILKELNK